MDSLEIKFLKEKTKQDFEILKKWTNEDKMTSEEALINLQELVAYRIKKLLETNHGQLMEVLYKADVSESKVKACFGAHKESKEIADEIASLYLERLLLKWKTRQMYKDDIEGDWN
jgi:hypothetical protein